MHKKEKDKKVYCTERGCAADIDIEKAEERENKRKRVGKGGTTLQSPAQKEEETAEKETRKLE